MLFEWDENKNRINKTKHGVVEEKALPLLVAHTYRDGQDAIIRIISARRAANHERKRYEKGIF
jgi:uncharacterized DUF497 family protein